MNILPATLLLIWQSWHIPAVQTCTVTFAGDMMQHKAQIESAFRDSVSFNYSECFSAIRPVVSRATLAVCNFETPLGGAPYSGYPAFSAPDEFADAVADAGFDIFLTANNHCLDKGKKGLLRTLDKLDSLKIAHIGTYRNQEERDSLHPLLVDAEGIRIAFLNYTYGTNGIDVPPPCIVNIIDTVQMEADLDKARMMNPDCVMVCVHWGDEYRQAPNTYQQRLAGWLIRHGADHVIGSHPHVVQPTVLYTDEAADSKGHVVAYSLGNFISNMSSAGTDIGKLLEIKIKRFISATWLDSYTEQSVRTLRPAAGTRPYFKVIPAE